jgi:mannitol/fructose-specific phosphotransferase system IIA component
LTKETNAAEVCVDGICDRDDASYFIGNGISIPNTGDAGLLIKTGIVLSLGLGGFLFRKYARGY